MTLEEFAQAVGMSKTNISLILKADSELPPQERRIKGAVKKGSKYRGEWTIPESAVATFERDGRGRPKHRA
jgi:transcriptional regulator with XRE-family HTH domain